MTFLIDQGSDITLKSEGKPLLYLAFEAPEPVIVTRALLKSGMWKHVNKPANLYSDGVFTYSPTMYVRKLVNTPHSDALYSILRTNRCEDIFYANDGAQPEDAVGMPQDILVEERARKARLNRLACEQEESALVERRLRAQEEIRRQLYLTRIELENSTRQKQHEDEVTALRARAKIEEEMLNAAAALSLRNHETELAQQEALRQAALAKVKEVGDLGLDYAKMKSVAMVEMEEKLGRRRMESAKALNALDVRHETEKMKRKMESYEDHEGEYGPDGPPGRNFRHGNSLPPYPLNR
jgi:hypothetical protein